MCIRDSSQMKHLLANDVCTPEVNTALTSVFGLSSEYQMLVKQPRDKASAAQLLARNTLDASAVMHELLPVMEDEANLRAIKGQGAKPNPSCEVNGIHDGGSEEEGASGQGREEKELQAGEEEGASGQGREEKELQAGEEKELQAEEDNGSDGGEENGFRFSDVGASWSICQEECHGDALVWEFHHSHESYQLFHRSFNKMVIQEVCKHAEEEASSMVREMAVKAKDQMGSALELQLEEFRSAHPMVEGLVKQHTQQLLDTAEAQMDEREERIALFPTNVGEMNCLMDEAPQDLLKMMDQMSDDIYSAEKEITQLWGIKDHHQTECKDMLQNMYQQKEVMLGLWGQAAAVQA
eukprot:TRINITY_DN1718_c0_g2_i1.p1 TRINITY_DN1718_c0_g2~~TRINITY_DN1718_c0_g2_i1.p1  ORF type:complete len:352 (+),score=104.34 TRINITY_DN1718_c0_g2_i1:184-1239(+)